MFTLKIKNDKGDIYELTHNYTRYYVTSIEGLTPPAVTVNTSSAGLIDGEFYNSSRMRPRNIVITVVLEGNIEANRQKLYSIFPLKKEIEIYYANKNRDVKIKGYVESIEGDIFVQREQMQISIICPRSYFEGTAAIQSDISRVVPLFEFPFNIEQPVPISELRSNPISRIENVGDVECGCIVTAKFKSVMTDFKITNLSTKQYLKVSDYAFLGGDILTICSIQGSLSISLVRGTETINLLPYVDNGSSWLEITSGLNIFTYSVTGGSIDKVEVNIEFTPLYGGV